MRAWLWTLPAQHYPVFEKTRTFAVRRVGRATLDEVRPGDVIFAYLSGAKVLAGMFEAVGEAFEDTTPLVRGANYRHRLRVRPLVVLSEEDRVPYAAFHDRLSVVGDYADFRAVAAQVLYKLPKVDEKVLEFLIRARQATDFEKLRAVLDDVRAARKEEREEEAAAPPAVSEPPTRYELPEAFDRAEALEVLLAYIEARGFIYEPWQVAAYVTALRTKPFVILAGVTGTGKSKLPALVEAATGGLAPLIPVRPDWTDSADVLGYVDLQGRFRPGLLLDVVRMAYTDPNRHHTALIDEMNLARVEQYFAEVLSRIEDRRPAPSGGFETAPLLDLVLPADAAGWEAVGLPPNFAIAGTVNMDESAHSFSRKVLDRAFTLELADIDLTAWQVPTEVAARPTRWPVAAWFPRAAALSGLNGLTPDEHGVIERAVRMLAEANAFLAPAQVQAAYRTRDEVALFVLHAADTPDAFRMRTSEAIDPLDLALSMKLLPRLQGGSRPLRQAVLGLLGWTIAGEPFREEAETRDTLDAWTEAGRPNQLFHARFPRTAARLCLMWERLLTEGFTSFWV